MRWTTQQFRNPSSPPGHSTLRVVRLLLQVYFERRDIRLLRGEVRLWTPHFCDQRRWRRLARR